LSECFLLPIDIALKGLRGYLRYVDDVRLFGESEDEVRADLIALERHCRERGLIPQVGKFSIRRAHSVDAAMGMLPSFTDPHHEDGGPGLSPLDAKAALLPALGGSPLRVSDKTRLRYVLYRAAPDSEILRRVLLLVPRHPEHTDAFFFYLSTFPYRVPIERLCLRLVDQSPYQFVRGEAWKLLAAYLSLRESLRLGDVSALENQATAIAIKRTPENVAELIGACHFLCAIEAITGKRTSRWLRAQSPLVQALSARSLPSGAMVQGGVAVRYLLSPAQEPGLSLIAALQERRIGPSELGVEDTQLAMPVLTALQVLGVVSGPRRRSDPISAILASRYGVPPEARLWRAALGADYGHGLSMLKMADAAFDVGRSQWLQYQNSFNHAIFLALQRQLQFLGGPGTCTTVDRNGKGVHFGVMLAAAGPFSKAHPTIGMCFRAMNARRNELPGSHPYDKLGKRTRHLTARERNAFVSQLRTSYPALIVLLR
jgi:hypothetical protein